MFPLLVQIAALITVIALVWLVVRAFKKHFAWGFAVLLLSPLSATWFGIKYWREEKTPFIVYISTFVTATALGLHLFTTWGGWELLRVTYHLNQEIKSQTLTREHAEVFMKASLSFNEKSGLTLSDLHSMDVVSKELARIAAGDAASESTDSESTSNEKPITVQEEVRPVRYRLAYIPIRISDARNHVGSTVKVTRKNVPEKEYRLISASADKIELSQRAGRGSYSFHYNNRDIEHIRVLTRQSY